MLLAIDIGNTNIVLGGIDNEKIHFIARLYTEKKLSYDQYTIQIKNMLDIYNIDTQNIDNCIISSVVPPVLDAIVQAVKTIIKKEPMIVGPGIKTGLNILTDNPAQLGSDLVVNSVASLNQFDAPLIIIDMGTATTISVIDKNKNYIGGCIVPGVKISLSALSGMTAQLPHISLDEPKKIIGSNTIDCMKSGIVFGNASMIDGMIERIEDDLGYKTTVIATGGIANHIIPFCKKEIIYDDNLLLKGLYAIYLKNNHKH
ncbi:type III pantothenate kinase [uncultured Tyzzerella sp.]|uniref:type III pantothenate kinase n=1 Tax=uncultured Tyzzerella sp. TaxID=2321398 RepID=UPI002943740E|nr:type III pantothenate kinase [uncultured Tyzzerella sp.]